MKIYIGSDHAGFELKEKLKEYLSELGYDEVEDKGDLNYDENDDYPDFVKPLAEAIVADEKSIGIFIGGTGFGEEICANRIKGVRAVVFYGPRLAVGAVDVEGRQSLDPYEIVRLSRSHNDANILSISARFVPQLEAKEAVKVFLETKFSGDERHVRRIRKIES